MILDKEYLFLGLENDENGIHHAVFRLVGENLDEVWISDEGVLLKDQVSLSNNLDSTHPLFIPYRVDGTVTKIKEAILTLYIDKYRAYERGTTSSGQLTSGSSSKTSSGASSKTSSGGGGGTTTASSDYFVKPDGSIEYPLQEIYSSNFASMEEPKVDSNGRFKDHVWLGNSALAKHRHKVQLNSHYHNIEHTHNIEHNHKIEGHTHDLEYGIFEDTYPSNISIYVNNNLVKSGINSDIEIDIAKFLRVGTTNIIKITSDTNGFIIANLWSSSFNIWSKGATNLRYNRDLVNKCNLIDLE